jgi:hypothetical protein
LRHTAVALWIAGGASPLQVKQLAGHERSTLTLDRYGHLYEGAHDKLMASLDADLQTSRAADVVKLAAQAREVMEPAPTIRSRGSESGWGASCE